MMPLRMPGRPGLWTAALLGLLAMAWASAWAANPAMAQGPGHTCWFHWRATPTESRLREAIAEMREVMAARPQTVRDVTSRGPLYDQRLEWVAADGLRDETRFVFPGRTLVAATGDSAANVFTARTEAVNTVLTACLIVARDHFDQGELEIGTAADWLANWQDGAALYVEIFDRPPRDPMTTPGGQKPPSEGRLRRTPQAGQPPQTDPPSAPDEEGHPTGEDPLPSEVALQQAPTIALALVGMAVAAAVAWRLLPHSADHVITVTPTAIHVAGRKSLPRRGEVLRFFQELQTRHSHFTVLIDRRPDGSVRVRFRGDLDAAYHQRVRNFMAVTLGVLAG